MKKSGVGVGSHSTKFKDVWRSTSKPAGTSRTENGARQALAEAGIKGIKIPRTSGKKVTSKGKPNGLLG